MMSNVAGTRFQRMRVLIVDNRPGIRDLLQNRLLEWGYDPITAQGDGLALIGDAKRKAKSQYCHIAIVDKRLLDDEEPSDISGLDLIQDIQITSVIVLTGYADHETTRTALIERGAFDVLDKTGPQSVRISLDRAVREVWKRREIEWVRPPELESAALVKRFFPNDGSRPLDEVDDILLRLFPEATRIKLELVSGAERTPSVRLRQRSAVMKVFVDEEVLPRIVKIARAGRISKEVENLNKVKGHFLASRYAQIQGDPVELWNIGGTVYGFVDFDNGYPAVTFAEYYATHESTYVQKAINNLKSFWKPIYNKRPDGVKKKPIFQAYSDVWGEEWLERLLQYRQLPEGVSYPDLFVQLGLPDPMEWIIKRVRLEGPGQYYDGGTPDTELALCHGDLHSSNFFVDTRSDVWVIDFERTGFGPILQDWVELENDILTHLIDGISQMSWSTYAQLLCDVLAPKTLSSRGIGKKFTDRFQKEYSAVKTIRSAAKECSGIGETRQYYWGLLLNALFRSTLLMKEYDELSAESSDTDKTEREKQKQELRVQILLNLLGAAMNCHRLEHWDKPWPPAEWQRILARPTVDSFAASEVQPTLSPALERIIKEKIAFVDPGPWTEKCREILPRVCRIEIPIDQNRIVYGTGFLIAANVVLTNYHVIEPLISHSDLLNNAGQTDLATRVRFRFDYRLTSNAQVLESPTVCKLVKYDWLIDYSPYAGENSEPTLEMLDHAIVKLDRDVGNEFLDANGRRRGWIRLSQRDDKLQPNAPLVIVQHPLSEPLKLAIDTEAVIGENYAGTLVQYRTNTEPGSSGSPCFNFDWELVALHHSGDPEWRPTYNAGTPILAIIRRLCEKRLDYLIE